jgi:hypothetical protein
VQVTEGHNPPRIQVTHKFEGLTTPAIYHHCGLSSLDEVGDGRADGADLDGVRAVPSDLVDGVVDAREGGHLGEAPGVGVAASRRPARGHHRGVDDADEAERQRQRGD